MKTINRISNIATITLILGILLEIFYPAFTILTLLSCAGIYVTAILKNRLQTGAFDIVLCTLCTLSLAWMAARNYFDYSLMIAPGLFIMYAFLLRAFRLSTGAWNRAIIIYGTLSIVCGVANVYFRLVFINYLIVALQLIIAIKILDPILERIGLEHRERRLAMEKERSESYGRDQGTGGAEESPR